VWFRVIIFFILLLYFIFISNYSIIVKKNANGRRGGRRGLGIGENMKFTRSEFAKQARRLKAKNENKVNA
jgi:uncharacterized membrane protein